MWNAWFHTPFINLKNICELFIPIMSGKWFASDCASNTPRIIWKVIALDVEMEVLMRLEAGGGKLMHKLCFKLAVSSHRTIMRSADKAHKRTANSLTAKMLTLYSGNLLVTMESR